MTQIFLKTCPDWVQKIIDEQTADRWVPAVKTDEWVFSDGIAHNLYFEHQYPAGTDADTGETIYETALILDGSTVSYDDRSEEQGLPFGQETKMSLYLIDENFEEIEIIAYRKYTPAHWEDPNGNWINGSWSNWSGWHLMLDGTKTEFTDVDIDSGYINFFPSEDEGPDRWTIQADEALAFPNVDNPNMLYAFFGPEYSSGYATRTWTNTKPAPENQ